MPGVFGDQGDHHGQRDQRVGEVEVRGVKADHIAGAAELPTGQVGDRWETDPVGLDHLGPIDPEGLGDGAVGGGVDDRSEQFVGGEAEHISDDQRQEDRNAPGEPTQANRQADHDEHHQECDPLVLRPIDRGHHGGQIEPDQHHHCPGDHRRQGAMDHLRAHEMDDQAYD